MAAHITELYKKSQHRIVHYPDLNYFFTLYPIGQDPKNKVANLQRPRLIVQPHQLKEPE